MKRSASICLMILALAQAIAAQNDARALWLVRSQTLTTDLLKDAADLSSTQRAVLWVKLGQRWWHEDPSRARTWITNAIEVVEQVPNKESRQEREERLETARTLLTIITPLDEKLAKRLLAAMTSAKSTDNDRSAAANGLIDAAAAVVKDDPTRAGELVAKALRTGTPNTDIHQLFFDLRIRDPKLADSLFAQALALARQDTQSTLLNSLTHVAFPALRGHGDDIPAPSDSLRIELLQIIVDLLNTNRGSGENSNCGLVSWVAQFLTEIERLLPKQGLILRQAINTCHIAWPVAQQQMEDAARTQPLDTIESLLKAAADAKDTEVRADYQYRAAFLATEHKDYERAIRLLEEMPKEVRGETWDSYRWQWAADGAIEHYKNSRFREMNLMLDAVPSNFQPLAKAAFVYWLPEKTGAETAPIIQILNDAIKGLPRSNIPEWEKYKWYFSLLRSTVKYQPADANAVLKDAIASLNKVKDAQPLDAYSFNNIGPSLLEMDEFVLKDTLSSIMLAQPRAQLRLALLDATLERLKTTLRN